MPAAPARALRQPQHSSFIGRTSGKTRPPVKVTGLLPRGQSCLSLVWTVWSASAGWRGMHCWSHT
jgi:hypothetical protein